MASYLRRLQLPPEGKRNHAYYYVSKSWASDSKTGMKLPTNSAKDFLF